MLLKMIIKRLPNLISYFIFFLYLCQKHFLCGLFHEVKSWKWFYKKDEDDNDELKHATKVSKKVKNPIDDSRVP